MLSVQNLLFNVTFIKRIIEVEGTMGPIKITGEWISILKATNDVMENPSVLKCEWKELWEKKNALR